MKKIILCLALLLMAGCANQASKPYPGKPMFDGKEWFTAQEFKMDMPRTFESGSCIAAGGTLLYRLPQMTWYCKEYYGLNGYHIESLATW